ncbi:MAG: hypothetical protein LBR11_00590 [Deltaproteobacteria bacterium]|jgi:hypothetical protein|nr:hypothetical protein [Deltaproteobacteria bacterium]
MSKPTIAKPTLSKPKKYLLGFLTSLLAISVAVVFFHRAEAGSVVKTVAAPARQQIQGSPGQARLAVGERGGTRRIGSRGQTRISPPARQTQQRRLPESYFQPGYPVCNQEFKYRYGNLTSLKKEYVACVFRADRAKCGPEKRGCEERQKKSASIF